MADCYHCKAPATHLVDEVWFDFGEPIMRFCSSKDLHPGEAPHVCDACKKDKACLLAQAVLEDAYHRGATGPLFPTRWWVKYVDGYVVGGDVGRPT